MSFRDPFKLVPVKELAELADKFTRNEIMSSNEIRQVIGIKPSDDPKADQLVNSNLNQSQNVESQIYGNNGTDMGSENNTESLNNENNIDDAADEIFNSMSEEQQNAVYQLISRALENAGVSIDEYEDDEEDEEIEEDEE